MARVHSYSSTRVRASEISCWVRVLSLNSVSYVYNYWGCLRAIRWCCIQRQHDPHQHPVTCLIETMLSAIFSNRRYAELDWNNLNPCVKHQDPLTHVHRIALQSYSPFPIPRQLTPRLVGRLPYKWTLVCEFQRKREGEREEGERERGEGKERERERETQG